MRRISVDLHGVTGTGDNGLAVVEEYYRVFEYEHLKHLDKRRIARLRGLLEYVAVKVKSRGRLTISGHEDDNRIYECAVAAKADYIITENTKHFKKPYKTTQIINARQLLKLLEGRTGFHVRGKND